MTSVPPTVGDLVDALSKLDRDLPTVVSTHYDNDIGLASEVTLYQSLVYPSGDGSFWEEADEDDYDDDDDLPDGAVRAIVIRANG